jgi:hypothetical protein
MTPHVRVKASEGDIGSTTTNQERTMANICRMRMGAFHLVAVFTMLGVVPAIAQAPNTVGGHIGLAFPLVSTTGSDTTTIADVFTIAVPVGISIKGPGRMLFDLELVPAIQDAPRDVSLTVHPGLLWGLGHGFSAGGRLAFVASSSTWGFTGVLIKSWPIHNSFFKAYFVETDFPVRFNNPPGGPSTSSFGFNIHFGVGF